VLVLFFLPNQVLEHQNSRRSNLAGKVINFFEIQDETSHQKLKENTTPFPSSPDPPAACQADGGPQFAPLYLLVEKVGAREKTSHSEKVKRLHQKG